MTYDPTFLNRRLKARAGVILFHEEKLLLMRQNNASFWVLPGGTLEENESLPQCAIRELEEEAGLVIDTPKLVGLSEFSDSRRHILDATFVARYISGATTWQPPYPENINDIRWVDEAEFNGLELKPQAIYTMIQTHWQRLANHQPKSLPTPGYLGYETI
jgi:8-oxo-dGTP pyrophosphatase MutT (NUDIX family)